MYERMKTRLPLVRPLFVPTILYIGLTVMTISWLDANPTSVWRIPVSLTPMIPGLFLAFGIVRAVRKLDELNQKIILESTAIGFTATLILTLTLGALELSGLATVKSVYISLFMTVILLVAKLVVSRKYE